MITAEVARRKSTVNSHAKELLLLCEQNILDAVKEGKFSTRVVHHYHNDADQSIVDAVMLELTDLGYKVKSVRAVMDPKNPYDQTPEIIDISWEL